MKTAESEQINDLIKKVEKLVGLTNTHENTTRMHAHKHTFHFNDCTQSTAEIVENFTLTFAKGMAVTQVTCRIQSHMETLKGLWKTF